MKKVVLIIVLVLVVATVSGGVVYFLMSNNNETNNELVQNNTQNTTQNTTNSSTKKEIYYRHFPISGCVITSQNSDGSRFKYKRKCDSCGAIQDWLGEYECVVSGKSYTSWFTCNKCKNEQKVLIQFTSEYK